MSLVGNVQLVAGNDSTLGPLFERVREEGIEPNANPDVYVRTYASFGVEEARELSQRASSRAVSSIRRVFIIVTPGMTTEAQNALLKTLEEPAGEALFFLVVPSPQQLLPTLRSRSQFLTISSAQNLSRIDADAFLKAVPKDRLDMLKPLLEKDEDEKRDIGGTIAFLSSLELQLQGAPEKHREGIKAVYRARQYITDKGSLTKALLEQVALLI